MSGDYSQPGMKSKVVSDSETALEVARDKDIDLVLSLGVEAVITNRPTDVLSRLRP